MLLSRLCGLLGAKSVSVEQVKTTYNSSKSNAKVDSKVGVHSSELEVDQAFERKLDQRLKLADSFPGSTPDLGAARALLTRAGLEDDMTLSSLVEMRGELNPLSKRQISLNLTQEAQGNLRLAGQYSGFKL